MARKDPLLRLAEAVADGDPVRWDKEMETNKSLSGKIEYLRAIEKIGAAHRTSPGESQPTLLEKRSADTTEVPAAEIPVDPLPKKWGHLEIKEKIGRGGFGEVFRAFDKELQLDVALKLPPIDKRFDQKRENRFLEEARKLARIRLSNVLRVYGAAKHDDRIGLWTELIEGNTLEELLNQQGTLGANEAISIGIDLCRALAAVHAAGLVHHDVKTSNIMREKGGRIVLMDFNAAMERVTPDDLVKEESAPGTPHFMPPESFLGKDSGIRFDIYSLGVVLYRLVTGKFPVEARNISELARKHRQGESVPLRDRRPDLPPSFVQAVEGCLFTEPEKRYSSAGEMEKALAASLGPINLGSDPPPQPFFWQRPILVGALAVSLLAISFFIYFDPLGIFSSFEVKASLFRVGAGTEERLLPGARLTQDSSLFLEIKGTEAMHVYVLNEDEKGEAFCLFPLSNAKLKNPLSPNILHRLPGEVDGEIKYWQASSMGARETILVVASRTPLPAIEAEMKKIPQSGSMLAFRMNPEAVKQTLRGIGALGIGVGGLGTLPENGNPNPKVPMIISGLPAQGTTGKNVWYWTFQLENPR